jgi:preprotein translocase subunit SecE
MVEPQDRREMRILLVVVAGFVAGVLLLFYIIATDL